MPGAEHPALPEPGDDWAGFRIESEIGAGGFGRVYAAWDPRLDRRVAIKILHGQLLDTAARDRFLRESRLAGGLDHPRILPIHAADSFAGLPYIVMRYVDGGDLREQIRNGPLSLARTVEVVSQIAAALDRAHRSGLVHRDVKPANILCAAHSEDVYLCDFGITRVLTDTSGGATLPGLTGSAAPPATPHYAAPEQLLGHAVGPPADVYSLACTAFECLTGRVPFRGDSAIDVAHAQVHDPPPTLTNLRPDLPAALDGVFARAMAKDPDERPTSARDFARSLADAASIEAADVIAGTSPAGGMSTDRSIPAVGAAGGTASSIAGEAGGEPVGESGSSATEPADTDATAPVERLPSESAEPVHGRSVFADPAPADPDATTVLGGVASRPAADVTAVDGDAWRTVPPDEPDDPGVVEVDWDGWDAPAGRRSVVPYVLGGVAGAALLVVGALVWRAVNTDAELDPAAGEPTESAAPSTTEEPFDVDELLARLPPEAGDCEPTTATGPDQLVQVACVREEPLDVATYTAYASATARDRALADAVAALEIAGAGTGECALGDLGTHGYTGRSGLGEVACRVVGRRVDFVWTEGDDLLGAAGGEGRYSAEYQAWSALVGRADDAFPLPTEAAFIADLPDVVTGACARDVDLTLDAGATVAVACRPDGEPEVVSSARFASAAAMASWIDTRARSLPGTLDQRSNACNANRFAGDPDRPAGDDDDDDEDDDDGGDTAPVAGGYTTWERGGETGTVLCFVNSSGTNVVFWTRDDSDVGSIAVTSGDDDIRDLLRWFRDDGYRS